MHTYGKSHTNTQTHTDHRQKINRLETGPLFVTFGRYVENRVVPDNQSAKIAVVRSGEM